MLDLVKEAWEQYLSPQVQKYCSSTPDDLFQYVVLPFGVHSPPET